MTKTEQPPAGNAGTDKGPARRPDAPHEPSFVDLASRFSSSGLFFMIVGTVFLWVAFETVERTHAAMSFVFVVVGIAILLYGTGTQGIGQFDSGQGAEQVARYKVALAGGAGVLAFCVAAGIVGFSDDMKKAFRVEQRYVRFIITAVGDYDPSEVGFFIPEIRINGNPMPAVRRGDRIEVYAPYIPNSDENVSFEIRADLHLMNSRIEPDRVTKFNPNPRVEYSVVLKAGGRIEDGGQDGGTIKIDSGLDFPRYTLKEKVDLRAARSVGGVLIR